MCKHAHADHYKYAYGHAHPDYANAHAAAAAPARRRGSLRTHFFGALVLFSGIAVAIWMGPTLIGVVTAEEALTLEADATELTRLDVTTFNGAIEVVPAEPGSTMITIEAVKRASGVDEAAAQGDLANVDVTLVSEDGVAHVVARRTDDGVHFGNSGVSMRIAVPAGLATALKTDNGRLSIRGVGAPVTAHTSNGAIEIDGAVGAVRVKTTNGAISIAATDAVVDARTTNGRVSFRGSLAEGAHSLTTTNGAIAIALPTDAQFSLQARTTNGRVDCDYDLATVSTKKRTHVDGRTSSEAAAHLTATTTNGGVSIRPLGETDE